MHHRSKSNSNGFYVFLVYYYRSVNQGNFILSEDYYLKFLFPKQILNLRVLDVRGCVERVRTLFDNGKSCLSSVAKVASDLSDMKELPINLPFEEY